MSTTENNRLIAEFMGYKMVVENHHGINIMRSPSNHSYGLSDLRYHTSWDWLMPVVEKIESFIFEDDEYYNFHILGGCAVVIISSHMHELAYIDTGKSKLDCVYKAVVEFIKWYNQQNQKS